MLLKLTVYNRIFVVNFIETFNYVGMNMRLFILMEY